MLKKSNKNHNDKVEREYFSVSELSNYSGIGERTLWSLIKRRNNPLPHIRVSKKIIKIKKTVFDEWMQSDNFKPAMLAKNIENIVENVLIGYKSQKNGSIRQINPKLS